MSFVAPKDSWFGNPSVNGVFVISGAATFCQLAVSLTNKKLGWGTLG
jgi:hypothetical protein